MKSLRNVFHNTSDKFNWPCHEISLLWILSNGVCLNSFDFVFVHKGVRCTNKTEMEDVLHYRNKKLSLPGDIIIYTAEELVMN